MTVKNMTSRTNNTESLEQMVDWERGLITGRIFVDDDIYKQEAEKLFLRAWMFLAHEDHLRNYGDFTTTYIGADPLLVVRQRDGSIKALLNACRHRGMNLCRADGGNAKSFGCSAPDAPSLVDYLGEMAWYLDSLVDRREGGTEIIGGVHKMRIRGNWKLAAEQFAGDNYHAIMTHASLASAWADPGASKSPGGFAKLMALPA